MKKKVLCLALGLILAFSQTATVSASNRKEQLQQEKAAAQSQLSAQQAKINELESQKNQLESEINKLDADLVNVLVEIDILKGELETKEQEIVKTKEDLTVAEQNRDEQYEAMKKRIQYLYEKGGNDAWAQMLLQAKDLASLLNQAEYVQKLYDSDRRSLEAFKETVQKVTDLGNQLETEKADLEIMQMEYKNQQASLETQLTTKKATSSDYAAQIANAENQAAEYASIIRRQNDEIQKIEAAEQKAAEEAARKAAEEAAAREEAERQEESNKHTGNNGTTSKPSNTGNSGTSKPSTSKPSTSKPSNNGGTSKPNNGGSTSKPTESKPETSVPYNPTGSAVVDYACQFVGNPYVYGGNSLTNGTDCSGFIKLVYEHFGVSLPRSSSAFRTVGRAVSYSQAMPGDIICYSGHVALYMGGGSIVHASNSKPYPQGGIKISSNAAYREILTVRRVL